MSLAKVRNAGGHYILLRLSPLIKIVMVKCLLHIRILKSFVYLLSVFYVICADSVLSRCLNENGLSERFL